LLNLFFRSALAREVWVQWVSRLVRIFNDRMEQIALHLSSSFAHSEGVSRACPTVILPPTGPS
jgi:hypothetical protein